MKCELYKQTVHLLSDQEIKPNYTSIIYCIYILLKHIHVILPLYKAFTFCLSKFLLYFHYIFTFCLSIFMLYFHLKRHLHSAKHIHAIYPLYIYILPNHIQYWKHYYKYYVSLSQSKEYKKESKSNFTYIYIYIYIY